ncbi:hypothetical protein [Pseudomonas sp. D(2018)]|uniref:hypothetical protein n=1 Tax=Pseudomonas sp. D(2018) TaxID=2502238 RepID=UPI0010FA604E|nr:hypothetical protein [Pseudomonas sp. D(2018)]
MADLKLHKVVSSLPGVLEADSIYLVRVGSGYDLYATNHSGTIVSYPLNLPTKASLGLDQVNNTSDANKPISTATQTALNAKQNALGYNPVQQGTGAGQLGNNVKIGWSASGLLLTIDVTDFANNWPISISKNAATATTLVGLATTVAELNYVDGVTSNIQTQLNAKLGLSGGTLTGNLNQTSGTSVVNTLTANEKSWLVVNNASSFSIREDSVAQTRFLIAEGGQAVFYGYTRLGDTAPAIKMKKLIGTTPATEGGTMTVNHGVTSTKIIGVQVLVFHTSTNAILPGWTVSAGFEYGVQLGALGVQIALHPTNSESILSKAFTVLITYEE